MLGTHAPNMGRLNRLLERYDGDFSADLASGTSWGATLRLTLTDSRSILFQVGQDASGHGNGVVFGATLPPGSR
jgi:hypothetical protein